MIPQVASNRQHSASRILPPRGFPAGFALLRNDDGDDALASEAKCRAQFVEELMRKAP